MNKLLIIVFLGLAATQVLSSNTTATEKWAVAPALVINGTELLLKSRDTLASAITLNNDATNNTNVTTITLAIPQPGNQKTKYIERTLVSSSNTAVQRSTVADITTDELNQDYLENDILTQNGDLSVAGNNNGKLTVYKALAGQTAWKETVFSTPAGVAVKVASYWNSASPKVAYQGSTATTSALYVANSVNSTVVYNLTSNTTEAKVDNSSVSVTPNQTVTSDTTTVTTFTTYRLASIDTNTSTTGSSVAACADDLTTNETGFVVCYLNVGINSSTITVNQSFLTTVTVTLKDGSTVTTEGAKDNTNVTDRTNYTLTSLLYVRVNLETQNVTDVKNLTSSLVTEYDSLENFKIVTKRDNTTTLVYRVVHPINETSDDNLIRAVSGDDKVKTLKDLNNNKLKAIGTASVESYSDGIVLFHMDFDGNNSNTYYTTYKKDLTVIDTQKIVVNNSFFRSIKSNSSEIFGVYDSTLEDGQSTDAVFVGKIFENSFASSIQTVFGFAALFLAAVFAL